MLLSANCSLILAILLAAVIAPPIKIGWVIRMSAVNRLRVSVSKASRMCWPIWLSEEPMVEPAWLRILPNSWACSPLITPCCVSWPITFDALLPICPLVVVPRLLNVFLSSLLRIEISLDVNWYIPFALTFGKYLVCAALRVFVATSFFSFEMFSCLLFRRARFLQLSRLSTDCALADSIQQRRHSTIAMPLFLADISLFLIFIVDYRLKLLRPIMLPSTKMLTL